MPEPATWARLTIPPKPGMTSMAQQLAGLFAERLGFDRQRSASIELVVEELLGLVLHYSFDDGKTAEGELSIEFKVESPFFRLNVIDLGLPFDLSMVVEYRAGEEEQEADIAGLSIRLLKHKTDRFRVLNQGQAGLRLEVAWFLPGEHIEEMANATDDIATPPRSSASSTPTGFASGDSRLPEPSASPKEEVVLQWLNERFAIRIARLVFRGYGYSYVYSDIYYPERVVAYMQSGLMFSCGFVTASGELVGHLALMKESAGSRALEWGVAVVAPEWRGLGLLEQMLRQALDYVVGMDETVLVAHAVTAHIYTQKTCSKYGFLPCALLLGYAPATMQFKGISQQPTQRESTFLALRCIKPMPKEKIYLPPPYAAILRVLLGQLSPVLEEEYLLPGDVEVEWSQAKTVYEVSAAHCVNVGRINISVAGADSAQLVWNETRRLAREGIDVIYLTINLADPGAARLVEIARQSGYSIAGLFPMMPFNYGLCLQFLCSCKVDLAKVQSYGEKAGWLKEQVCLDYQGT